MEKRKKRMIINWIMFVSLIVVFVSGILLKVMGASMWLGITHGVSGIVLFITAMIHCLQHGTLKR